MTRLNHNIDQPINSLQVGINLVRLYPLRSVIVLVSLFIAGLLEVIGAAALLPMIAEFTEQEEPSNALFQRVAALFEQLNMSPNLMTLVVVISVLIILKALVSMLAMRNVGFAMADMANDMRLRLIYASMRAKWAHFNSLPLGRMSNALGAETNRAAETYLSLCRLASEVMVIMLYLVTVLFISWELTAAALVIGLIIMGVLYKLVIIVKKAGQQQTRHMNNLAILITDSIASVKIIKAMGREKHFINLLKKESEGLQESKKRTVIGNQSLRVAREPVAVVIIAFGVFFMHSYSLETTNSLDMASIVTFAFMFLRIVQKLTNLQALSQVFVSNESAYWSLKSAIDVTEKHSEVWFGEKKVRLDRSIQLCHIHYRHMTEASSYKLFTDLSIVFPVRRLSAIVGASGSGKTTLVDMIVGLYAPQRGQVLLDGTPLESIDIGKWRQSIGYVPQECPLLHDSIFNNIAMGNKDITEEDVTKSLELAGASGFVAQLDNGIYQTVGERGQRFSGGQRQRIAIARALVTRPQLLIFDEATSAVDERTEKAIFETAKKLSSEITVLVISHNDEIIKYADLVHHLRDGQAMCQVSRVV